LDDHEYESYDEYSYVPEESEPRHILVNNVLRKHIGNRVFRDPRSRKDKDGNLYPLGYPAGVIWNHVIQGGLANFSNEYDNPKYDYGELSPDDKVLLYCFFIMRGRFDTALEVFRIHFRQLEALFALDGQTYFLDFGCGPGTACFALAGLLEDLAF